MEGLEEYERIMKGIEEELALLQAEIYLEWERKLWERRDEEGGEE
jgi:hypothetical protein